MIRINGKRKIFETSAAVETISYRQQREKPAWNKNTLRWVGHSEIVVQIKSANTGVIIETGESCNDSVTLIFVSGWIK